MYQNFSIISLKIIGINYFSNFINCKLYNPQCFLLQNNKFLKFSYIFFNSNSYHEGKFYKNIFQNFLNGILNLNSGGINEYKTLSSIQKNIFFEDTLFKNITSETSIIFLNDTNYGIVIKRCGFIYLNKNNIDCIIQTYRCNNFIYLNSCSEFCNAFHSFLGVSSHNHQVNYASMNFSLEYHHDFNRCSSWIGAHISLTTYYNNFSDNKVLSNDRCGICITNCNSGEIGGYCQAINCNGYSLIAFFLGSSSINLNYYNFINNTLFTNGGWFDFRSTLGFVLMKFSAFLKNSNQNWIGILISGSKITLENCYFDYYPINSNSNVILNSTLNTSTINLFIINTKLCWTYQIDVITCQIPKIIYLKSLLLLFSLYFIK